MAPGRNDYRFVTEWRVAGTVEEVKAVLSDAEALPRWWPAVYLSVSPGDEGDADGVGRSVDLHTKGWLPYTLRWTLRITEPITDAGFALSAEGDLEGAGRWVFRQDGPEVVITYDWRVRATKALLVRLSCLLKPGFSANHHWAMATGRESLALELRRRRATTDAERALVPAPPPTTFGPWPLGRQTRQLARPPPGRGRWSPIVRLADAGENRRRAIDSVSRWMSFTSAEASKYRLTARRRA